MEKFTYVSVIQGGIAMNNNVLQTLIRCYANSREPVLLLDEKWNVVWSIRDPGIGYLPAVLGITEDSWESSTRSLRLGDIRYTCSLVCNPQDGVRIAVLHQPDNGIVPVESDVISTAVSSINAACAALHGDLPDEKKDQYIRAITGNCFKIYRTTYLQKVLDRRQAGSWQAERFFARMPLMALNALLKDNLRDTTDLEFSYCDDPAYLIADLEAFTTTLLAAIAVCYREELKDKRHKLSVRMDASDGMVIITLSMTPTPEDRDDHQDRIGDFGSVAGEKMLLDAFCKEYGGSWLQNTTGDTTSVCLKLPAADPSVHLTLHSPQERSEGRFFNKYEILLARIRFRGFF